MALQTYSRKEIEKLKTAPRVLTNIGGRMFRTPQPARPVVTPPVAAPSRTSVLAGGDIMPSRQPIPAPTPTPTRQSYVDPETGKTVFRPVSPEAYAAAVEASRGYVPGTPAAPRLTPAVPTTTGLNTYRGARAGGFVGSFSDWVTAGRPTGGTGTATVTAPPATGIAGAPPPRISEFPSEDKKVVKVGGEPEAAIGPTFATPEEQNIYEDQITLKQVKGIAITDEEQMYLIKKAREQAKVDMGPFEELQKKYTTLEEQVAADREAKRKQIEAEQDEILAAEKAGNLARYERSLAEAQAGGAKRAAATQGIISFSGFGRSTYAAEKADEVQQDVNRHIEGLQAARDAADALAEARARGATDKELEGFNKRLNELQDASLAMQFDVATKVANLNAENKVKGQEAIANLIKVLGADIAKEVDKDASALVGFVADKNGKAILVNGKVMPIAKAEAAFDEDLSKQLGYLVDKNRKPIKGQDGNTIPYTRQTSSGTGGTGAYDKELSEQLGKLVDSKGRPLKDTSTGGEIPYKGAWGSVDEKSGKTVEQAMLDAGISQELINVAKSANMTPADLID